jgi:hypothetical protein
MSPRHRKGIADEANPPKPDDSRKQTAEKVRRSKIAVTMEIYTRVPSDATRSALRKLGKWLDT